MNSPMPVVKTDPETHKMLKKFASEHGSSVQTALKRLLVDKEKPALSIWNKIIKSRKEIKLEN